MLGGAGGAMIVDPPAPIHPHGTRSRAASSAGAGAVATAPLPSQSRRESIISVGYVPFTGAPAPPGPVPVSAQLPGFSPLAVDQLVAFRAEFAAQQAATAAQQAAHTAEMRAVQESCSQLANAVTALMAQALAPVAASYPVAATSPAHQPAVSAPVPTFAAPSATLPARVPLVSFITLGEGHVYMSASKPPAGDSPSFHGSALRDATLALLLGVTTAPIGSADGASMNHADVGVLQPVLLTLRAVRSMVSLPGHARDGVRALGALGRQSLSCATADVFLSTPALASDRFSPSAFCSGLVSAIAIFENGTASASASSLAFGFIRGETFVTTVWTQACSAAFRRVALIMSANDQAGRPPSEADAAAALTAAGQPLIDHLISLLGPLGHGLDTFQQQALLSHPIALASLYAPLPVPAKAQIPVLAVSIAPAITGHAASSGQGGQAAASALATTLPATPPPKSQQKTIFRTLFGDEKAETVCTSLRVCLIHSISAEDKPCTASHTDTNRSEPFHNRALNASAIISTAALAKARETAATFSVATAARFRKDLLVWLST